MCAQNYLNKTGKKILDNGQKKATITQKLPKTAQNVMKMVKNILVNSPNDDSNTNANFPIPKIVKY